MISSITNLLGDGISASSNLIESGARGATGLLTGGPSPDAAAQDARGGEMVRDMALGGAAIGGGTGALVALLNYLKATKEEAELEDESRLNDDTLYIAAPGRDKAAGVNRWVAPGLAATGGILSATGAYYLTQALYNHIQKKRRQKMLDEAQGEALAASDAELGVEKSAAKMGLYDLMTAFPVAVPLLAALASGGVAYTALNKTFPTVRRPKSKFPKRIRLAVNPPAEGAQGEDTDTAEDAREKEASLRDQELEDAGHEFLMLVVSELSHQKGASIRLTSDLLNRAAKDGIVALEDLQKQGGIEAVAEAVKGASDAPAPLPDLIMAAAALAKSARLAPVARNVAAAEFQDLVPNFFSELLSLGEEAIEKVAGVAPLVHMDAIRPSMLKAAASSPLQSQLATILEANDALTSDSTGGLADDMEGEDMEGGLSDPDIAEAGGDPVDDFIAAGGDSSPILSPDVNIDEDREDVAPSGPGLL